MNSDASGSSQAAAEPAFVCVPDGVDLPHLPDPGHWDVRRRRASWRRAATSAARPSTVVLDIGGVLVPSLFESVRGVDRPFPPGPLTGDAEYAQVERGEIGEREYWQRIGEQGWDVGRLWRECSSVRTLLWKVLAVAGRRMRLVAFTNDMAHWFGPDWLARFPQLAELDLILEASELGVLKPAPEAFRRALAVIGERPAQCLMVDDHPANLNGATSVGMPTLQFDVGDPEGSVEALRQTLALPAAERPTVFRVPARRSPAPTHHI
ncbi:MAG: HAD-IA family hydrolase [Pseudonocardia sp.]|nr:HAD-IA family hydrolase [Actinomycetes bacterium]MDN5913823.1 HAD-IA family hydrolase [Pseudonocardia sp.]